MTGHNNIDTILYEAFNSGVHKLGSSRVNIFSVNDPYASVPFFRFRFSNLSKDSYVYKMISDLITKFNGNLKWLVITKPETSNFVLVPEIFVKNICSVTLLTKELFLEKGTISEFSQIIDMAINDVVNIAVLVRDNLIHLERTNE